MDTLDIGSKTTKTEKKVLWMSSKRCFGHTMTPTTVGFNEESPADVSAADKAKEKAKRRKTTEKAEGSLGPSAENEEKDTTPRKHPRQLKTF